MSIYRQSSPEEAQSSIYGSRLMVKDSQIQKLQNEVAELTQAKLDYQHSEDALDRLKKKVQDAEREKVGLGLFRIRRIGAIMKQ